MVEDCSPSKSEPAFGAVELRSGGGVTDDVESVVTGASEIQGFAAGIGQVVAAQPAPRA